MTRDEAVPIREVPDALTRLDDLAAALDGHQPAVFLDYDGTLTPIVDDPATAVLDPDTRDGLRALALRHPVAVVSGRDLDDVRTLVDLDDITFAGSHGFDILLADGTRHRRGDEYRRSLDAAEQVLRARLDPIPGAQLERKRYALAAHFRRVPSERAEEVPVTVAEVAESYPDLRVTGGKMIAELRPDLEWDKGRALRLLIELLDLRGCVPVYVGDDLTDEDAFLALPDPGAAVVVRGEDDDRPTRADFALADPAATRELLRWLAELSPGGDA